MPQLTMKMGGGTVHGKGRSLIVLQIVPGGPYIVLRMDWGTNYFTMDRARLGTTIERDHLMHDSTSPPMLVKVGWGGGGGRVMLDSGGPYCVWAWGSTAPV